MSSENFGEDYFMNGVKSGLSNYMDYKWLPDLTLPMAKSFMQIFGVPKESTVLDFGCARGFFVKALMEHGVNAFGIDVSEWAIKNCHKDVFGRVFNKIEDCPLFYDYIFSKDVLEHIPMQELIKIIPRLLSACMDAAIFIVPLAKAEGGEYVYPSDELDITHIHRKTLDGWIDLIQPIAKDFTIFTSKNIAVLKKPIEQYAGCAGVIYCKKIKK